MTTIAETTSGPVQGRVKDDVLLFAGIPYAAPPIGARRFQAASPAEPWVAVRAATRFGPAAPQVPGGGMTDNAPVNWNEDCLFLNISTPQIDDGGRPVLVWIHGGGYRTGQGGIPWYNGASFARNGDIVVVSINYRLGALGFTDLSRFGAEYETSGVNGLLDQITALEWVRDNIAAFGGDPARVTIAGESAGGFSVSTLLGSARAEGLFQRAIPQSGAAHHTITAAEGTHIADLLIKELGATSMADLQAASADDILAAQGKVDVAIREERATVSPFYPVEGNPVVPVSPLESIRAGQGSDVDVLIGSNKDEATLFIQQDVDEAQLSKDAKRLGGGDALVDAYRRSYPGASATDLAVAMSSDHMFRIPAIRLAEARWAHQANTWMYLFRWESRSRLKSTHALEIPFVFNNLDKNGVDVFLGPGELPQGVADTMHAVWTAFVRGEDPGWERYLEGGRATMCFDTDSGVESDPNGSVREAWDGLR